MPATSIQTTVEEIIQLYNEYGAAAYAGEEVSQLEHMVQAAQLAKEEGHDDEVVLAAFLHDIGHLAEYIMPVVQMEGAGVANHEQIGADYLQQKGFSKKICRLVQSHVSAKRYLTFKYPAYYEKLSAASKTTLAYQGGAMTATEANLFEADPLHPLYIKLREWDDKAKLLNQPIPSLQVYRQLMLQHLHQ